MLVDAHCHINSLSPEIQSKFLSAAGGDFIPTKESGEGRLPRHNVREKRENTAVKGRQSFIFIDVSIDPQSTQQSLQLSKEYPFIPTRNTPPVRAGMERGRNTKYSGRDSALRKPEMQDTAAVRPQSFIYSCIGFHPFSARQYHERIVEDYERAIGENEKIVGIGEVGLDYKADISVREQVEIFRKFIELARKVNLALVIHNRLDSHRILDVLDEHVGSYERVVFHCFSQDEMFAKRVLEKNGYVSFSLNILRKKPQIIEALKTTPVDNLLLETDSPYMRIDKRNSLPFDIEHVYACVAEVKNLDRNLLEEKVFANAQKVFKGIADSV